MKRGDLASAVLPGSYGKPRPVLIIQSDLFLENSASVTILPLTSDILKTPVTRVTLNPSAENGLKKASQVMIDKLHTLPRAKMGYAFGRISQEDEGRINRALAQFLDVS